MSVTKPLRHIPPYTQQYRFEVSSEYAGKSVIDFYVERFGFKPREYWLEMIAHGDILLNRQGVDAGQILKVGDVLHTIRRDVAEPPVNDEICIIHEADGVLVLNKQAPIPIHPSGRYFKNSLIHILKEKNPGKVFHTIHRLDTWTTGVLVMATEAQTARYLHLQVEKRQMKKVYGVLATGDFGDKEFSVNVPVGRVDGAHRGTGPNITEARESLTIFTPLGKKNHVTFLRAEPITGRTNQIRVHVQAAGGAVLHDPLYGKGDGAFAKASVQDSPNKFSFSLRDLQRCSSLSSKVSLPDEKENLFGESCTEAFPAPSFMGLHCRAMEFSLAPGQAPQKFVADWPRGYLEYFSKEELDQC